jgi:carbon storage regulator
MLVLSRQVDETLYVFPHGLDGPIIEITVVDIRGDKVRLGVNAPASMPVHRKEVYEALRREMREEEANAKFAADTARLASQQQNPPQAT